MNTAPPKSRYRLENGQPILDVRVESMEQLFDNRDPAPFRDRDLDPALVEYLIDGARDLASSPLRVEVWLGLESWAVVAPSRLPSVCDGQVHRSRCV